MRIESLDIGLQLRVHRVVKRIPQRAVAAASSIPRTVLSEIECGWRKPTPNQLIAICQAIGISPSDLGDDVPR